MCGRLRCCLVYEYEQYVEARKQLPRRNKRIGTPHGEGRVIDQLPLLDAVRVDLGEGVRKTVLRADIIPLEEFPRSGRKGAKAPATSTAMAAASADCQRGSAWPTRSMRASKHRLQKNLSKPNPKKSQDRNGRGAGAAARSVKDSIAPGGGADAGVAAGAENEAADNAATEAASPNEPE